MPVCFSFSFFLIRLVSEEDARGARGTWKERDLGVISLRELEGREIGGEEE